VQTTTNALRAQLEVHQQALASAGDANKQLKIQLNAYEQLHKDLTADTEAQKVVLGRLEQQLTDQGTLIADKEIHIRSLEEKHQNAREALEHYRQSIKDQRDQDLRRHEHQVQQLQAELRQVHQTLSIKQTDLTHLNTADAELIAEVRQLRKALNNSEQQHQAAKAKLSTFSERANYQIVQLTAARSTDW
jgi:chromosome segregation ATPase